MRQIIAIGGGGFGRNPGEGIIEKYILKQASSKRPNICFIPTATGDDDSYKLSFYSTFTRFNCNPTHLDLFKRTPILDNVISRQDIIFVGGGNTKSMLAVWRDWGLDRLLKKAYFSGTIMSGVSAGAICWFSQGVTDSWAKQLYLMPCLNFIPGACCPHYDEEPDRRPAVTKFLKRKKLKSALCIEGGAAVHIKNGKIDTSISFGKQKRAYQVKMQGDQLEEKEIKSLQIN